MLQYTVVYAASVRKDVRGIPQHQLRLITKRIAALATDPRPPTMTKLKGQTDLYRVRQGDHRIIYTIEDAVVTITIIEIGNRKNIYDKY